MISKWSTIHEISFRQKSTIFAAILIFFRQILKKVCWRWNQSSKKRTCCISWHLFFFIFKTYIWHSWGTNADLFCSSFDETSSQGEHRNSPKEGFIEKINVKSWRNPINEATKMVDEAHSWLSCANDNSDVRFTSKRFYYQNDFMMVHSRTIAKHW